MVARQKLYNGTLNAVTNSHKGIRRVRSETQGDRGWTKNGAPRFIVRGTIYLTRLNAYFIALLTGLAGQRAQLRLYTYICSVLASFPLCGPSTFSPASEIFKMFSKFSTSNAVTSTTYALAHFAMIASIYRSIHVE